MKKKAVVLLSGGLDSATVLAIARSMGFDLYALTFNYGQRHTIELDFAKKLAKEYDIKKHIVVDIPSDIFLSSSLVKESGKEVEKNRDMDDSSIPSTYVPARNILFLSYGLSFAESIGASNIFIGVNALDYSGYPDCRPEFIEAYGKMANLGTKIGVEGQKVKIETPLINLSKADIIKKGSALGVDYSITHSCYDPDSEGLPCGECDSCVLRKKGFIDAGVDDPTPYRK